MPTRAHTPLRSLGLRLRGSPVAPLVARLHRELDARGLRLRPRCYLSIEWGVPDDSSLLGIPYYLVDDELAELQRVRYGLLEGLGPEDILHYLRHEMGHVLNYAYRLYAAPAWTALFGDFNLPYADEYRPLPFSARFGCHLAGFYGQRHPDEDWAETFALWLDPGRDTATEFAGCPEVLGKLAYCARVMHDIAVRDRTTPPPRLRTTIEKGDDPARLIGKTPAQLCKPHPYAISLPAVTDAALRATLGGYDIRTGRTRLVAKLLERRAPDLVSGLFRSTGHYPERSWPLVFGLRDRARALDLRYQPAQEAAVLIAATMLLTTLATNLIHRGRYTP